MSKKKIFFIVGGIILVLIILYYYSNKETYKADKEKIRRLFNYGETESKAKDAREFYENTGNESPVIDDDLSSF